MLRNASELVGLPIHATDGDIGSVSKLFFDDEQWTVRYLVVDTGKWLPGRKVLISPRSIRQESEGGPALNVSLTRQQVKDSPDVDTEQPVSRQQEIIYHGYYGYPRYWGGAGLWGIGMHPWAIPETQAEARVPAAQEARAAAESGDSHLRDASVVRGYHIGASEGEVGHVDDFIVDDRNWQIRYLIVDTSNWLGGRHVLVSPDWVRSVSWHESRVHVALPREAIRNSPAYDARQIPTREYEQELYAHYERAGYWRNDDVRARGSRHPDEAPRRSVAARTD